MNVQSFHTPADLVEFVATQGILQAKVQQIMEDDGRWFLFWWT